jgi:hypothetical protein
MRGVLVATLTAFLLMPAAAFSGRGSTPGTVLHIADVTPFVVRGSGFQSKERVRVVLRSNGRHVKTLVATPSGTFKVRFPGVSLRRCVGYFVRATGSKGSRAYVRLVPECAAD